MEKIEVYIVPLLTTAGAALHGFLQDIEKDPQSDLVEIAANQMLPSVILTIKPLVEIGAEDSSELGEDVNQSLLTVCGLIELAVEKTKEAGIKVPFDKPPSIH